MIRDSKGLIKRQRINSINNLNARARQAARHVGDLFLIRNFSSQWNYSNMFMFMFMFMFSGKRNAAVVFEKKNH